MCGVSNRTEAEDPTTLRHRHLSDPYPAARQSRDQYPRRPSTALHIGRHCIPFLLLVLLSGFAGGAVSGEKPAAVSAPASTAAYVGSQMCAGCHNAIYRSFAKTPMGQSMTPAAAVLSQNLSLPAHVTNEKLDRHFDVLVRDGKLHESEYALAADGSEIFRDTRAIDWIIGAGVNGFGPVVERDHYLFQAPLSFYTKPGAWGPSPGYEATDLGFNRPILTGCISCHAGRANPVAGANGQYADPPFSQLSIGCENCHGPGAAHVQAMSHEPATKNKQIVNPARLSAYLADNICMACHQTGDVRVLKPGKSYSDIRPGEPLDTTLSILIVPPTPDAPPDADHVEHYYSMTLSKCYRSSAGRLRCISCHDPHVQPAPAESPAYFRSKCLTCHSNQSCKIPLQTRMNMQPSNDCVGCHMPKRDIQVISHSSATNHRILAKPDEPFPDVTFHQTTPVLPDLIDLDPAPGKGTAALPDLTLLQAYGELAAQKPQYVSRYLDVLARLEKSQPENSLVQAALGRRELKGGNFDSAVDHLQRAIAMAPSQATTCADLADALTHLDRKNEAVTWLEKSIQLDPFNPFTQRTLIARLIDLKQYVRARAALEHYAEVFPQDTFMRQMLEKARTLPTK